MTSTRADFAAVRNQVPISLGPNAWYLITASALVACGKPDEIGTLSHHIHTQLDSGDKEQRERISKRLRDVLMKAWILVGIPLVVTAVASLAKAEEGLGLDSDLSEKWASTSSPKTISNRGTTFIQTLHAQNLAPIFSTWGSHRPDFEYLQINIIYGMFLSDHSLLSAIEAELVTLVSIMCQGLRAPTIWHLRGLRRLGVSAADVESVERAVEIVAKWAGKETEGWARVDDVVLD